jgi:hypothetical protein
MKFCLVLIALLVAAAAQARNASEWLVPRDRETLDVAEQIRSELKTKTVYVGRGETQEGWTRRISVWFYPGIVFDRGGFATWIEGLRLEVVADCPGARASELRLFDWEGLAAAEFDMACQFYPATGRPDIYLLRTMQGRDGQLVAAITFRQAPTEAETRAARAYLDSLILCTPTSALPLCEE